MRILKLSLLITSLLLAPALWAVNELIIPTPPFVAGTLIRSADMNANFDAVKTAVNHKQNRVTGRCNSGAITQILADGTVRCSVSSNLVMFPDGVESHRSTLVYKPADYTLSGPTSVKAIFSAPVACELKNVRLGISINDYILGLNDSSLPVPGYNDKPFNIPTSTPPDYVIKDTGINFVHDPFKDMMSIDVRRTGAHSSDTCDQEMTFYGVRVSYPTATGTNHIFIPAHMMVHSQVK